MKLLRLGLMFVLGLLVIGSDASHASEHESHYVSSIDLPPQLLPPPPEEGSKEWKKNIQGVLAAQQHIAKKDSAAIRDEQHLRLSLITNVIGTDFTAEKFPRTYELLQNVFEDSEFITGADKKFWHTRRPYLTDKQVKLFVDRIDSNPAYPSGHTSASRVAAEVLGMLFPDRLGDLRARAESIAYHRVQAGVHYPVDVEGGRMLAMMIIGALSKSADFQSDLTAAKEEIAEQPLFTNAQVR